MILSTDQRVLAVLAISQATDREDQLDTDKDSQLATLTARNTSGIHLTYEHRYSQRAT